MNHKMDVDPLPYWLEEKTHNSSNKTTLRQTISPFNDPIKPHKAMSVNPLRRSISCSTLTHTPCQTQCIHYPGNPSYTGNGFRLEKKGQMINGFSQWLSGKPLGQITIAHYVVNSQFECTTTERGKWCRWVTRTSCLSAESILPLVLFCPACLKFRLLR